MDRHGESQEAENKDEEVAPTYREDSGVGMVRRILTEAIENVGGV